MIVTVTMNPAIDKTVTLDTFIHGGLNRIRDIVLDAGGKGINVSKTISKSLGGSSVATGFLGGDTGKKIRELLREYEIKWDFVEVEGESRTNTKLVEPEGLVTELNEPGPEVSLGVMDELLNKLDTYAGKHTLFILSGSIPRDVSSSIYRIIIERVHKKGARVCLDADGELFREAMKAGPDMIKPNRLELERYFNLDHPASLEELQQMADQLLEKGVELAVISLGKEGALFCFQDQIRLCPALQVEACSTVGAGDAMVAAMAWCWEQKKDFDQVCQITMAAAAGAVMTAGTCPPDSEMVGRLLNQQR